MGNNDALIRLSESSCKEGEAYLKATKELHPLYCKSNNRHLSFKQFEEKRQKSDKILSSFHGRFTWNILKREISVTLKQPYFPNLQGDRPWGFESHYNYCLETTLKSFNRAIDANPGNTNALYGMACTQELLEDYSKSLEYLEKLLKIDPKHVFGLTLKTKCFVRLGDKDDAKKSAAKLSSLSHQKGSTNCPLKSKSSISGKRGKEATEEDGDDWLMAMKYGRY